MHWVADKEVAEPLFSAEHTATLRRHGLDIHPNRLGVPIRIGEQPFPYGIGARVKALAERCLAFTHIDNGLVYAALSSRTHAEAAAVFGQMTTLQVGNPVTHAWIQPSTADERLVKTLFMASISLPPALHALDLNATYFWAGQIEWVKWKQYVLDTCAVWRDMLSIDTEAP
jgi:hypothetical protein